MTSKSSDDYYLLFSASLRVFGKIENPDYISEAMALQPTYSHRRGERRSPRAKPYAHDMWTYQPPIDELRPLDEHIAALWAAIRPKATEIRKLKQRFKVDVFCGYRSSSNSGQIQLSHEALELFFQLEVPLDVSVIVA